MSWGRAKTILLIMFLLVDVFLFMVLFQTNVSSYRISKDIIQKTAAILTENNIQISAEKIPNKRPKSQNIVMKNYFEQPEIAAEKTLGKTFNTVLADKEKHSYHYENEQGVLHVKDNNFTYSSKKTPVLYPQNVEFDMDSARYFLEKALEKMGFEKRDVFLQNIEEHNGLILCEVIPLYKKAKIHGVSMYITADSEKIIMMSGNWFVPSTVEIYEQESLTDITTVLVNLMYRNEGYKITEIFRVEHAFYASENYLGSKNISAVPIYVLEDQNHSLHYFDARSGNYIMN